LFAKCGILCEECSDASGRGVDFVLEPLPLEAVLEGDDSLQSGQALTVS
jgi:hypothetical protein